MDHSHAGAGLDAHRLERIGEHLRRNYVDPGKIAGCQVAVARHGRLAYLESFGQMDLERGKPMAADTIFRIYSMSKPITSVALMMLYERGYFQLNDPVSRFFPSWKDHRVWVSGRGEAMQTEPTRRPVSMRDLLTHTGGLTYGGSLANVGAPESADPVDDVYRALKVRRTREETLETFMEKLAQVPLRFQPGERWIYSFSTSACGALVERISGKRFDRFLKEELFEPLSMTDTAFLVPPEKKDRFAACYRRGADKSLKLMDDPAVSPYLEEPAFFGGGEGLVGTTRDYMRFCEMLRRGGELDGARILGPRTLELMTRNHLPGRRELTEVAAAGFTETAYDGVGFGLGFATTLDAVRAGSLGEGDFYWGGAASTIFWVDPREDLSVVFMCQLMPSATFNFRGQLKSLIYSAITD